MKGSLPVQPLPWSQVLLAITPGILFGIARININLGIVTMIAMLLIGILAFGILMVKKFVPVWGLLALGFFIGEISLLGVFFLPEMLHTNVRMDINTGQLLVAIPLWLAILVLARKAKVVWLLPLWVWALLFMASAGILASKDLSGMNLIGVMLLPVALGIPLSRRQGSLAVLFVVGAYSVWLADSDTISGFLLRDHAFYPYYAVLLSWLFMSIGPLLFLRARSHAGQAVGLLAPLAAVLVLRVAVPYLLYPDVHPARIWRNDAIGSAFTLLMLCIALAIYSRTGPDQEAGQVPTDSQLAFNG